MTIKTKILVSVTITLAFFASGAIAARAQNDTVNTFLQPGQPGEASPKIFVNVTPENPRAGDSVSIELESTWTDLNQADISWSENGNATKSGLGQTRYFITAGQAGSQIIVTAAVRTAEGSIYSYDIPIRPGSVDIVWESNSTVPPFYKGKALYPMLGTVKLIAIPNMFDSGGRPLDPKTLVYTWKKADRVLGSQSGLGKYYTVMGDDIYRVPFSVNVTAATNDGKYVAEGSISIDAVTPFIEIYQNNPIYGVLFNKTVGGQYAMAKSEMSFDAYPFYFSTRGRFDPTLVYNWSLNYEKVLGQSGPSISLKGTGESGNANLYIEVVNQIKFYEGASASVNLSFSGNR